MASTRNTLENISANLEESMGVREHDLTPTLRPVALPKDTGRKPLRNVGKVDINNVIPDPDQPRLEFSEESISRLAASIREKGQLSAIRVRWSQDLGKWIIIAGERRWRATKEAGLPTIDCYFHDGELTKSVVLEQQLIENCLREDLQPMEEAKAFSTLMALNDWTGKQLAEALRLPPARISRALALLKLPDDDSRRQLADKALSGSLTHEKAAKAVRQRKGKRRPAARATRQTFMTEDGWKVVVSANKKGSYHDIEQALIAALDEVRHRMENNVQIF